jgi:hypothetical protein
MTQEEAGTEGRARFLAEFTLSTQSEILRFAQDDSEGLGMTLGGESEIKVRIRKA